MAEYVGNMLFAGTICYGLVIWSSRKFPNRNPIIKNAVTSGVVRLLTRFFSM